MRKGRDLGCTQSTFFRQLDRHFYQWAYQAPHQPNHLQINEIRKIKSDVSSLDFRINNTSNVYTRVKQINLHRNLSKNNNSK